MKNLTAVLDEFVLKLKKLEGLCGVRFIHAGRGDFAQKPLDGFLVACSAAKEEFRRDKGQGEEYKGTMEFTLYAPLGEGKRALTLLSQRLAEGLKESDVNHILETITISDSSFDSNMSVWKQVVSALVSEKAEVLSDVYSESVYLGTRKLTSVTSFEVTLEYSDHKRRELLWGEREEYIAPTHKYIITMSVYGEDLLFGGLTNKSINIYRQSTNTTYDDCRLKKLECDGNGRQNLTFVCQRAHKGAEVTQ